MTLCEVKPADEYIANSAKGDEEKYRVTREGFVYTIRESTEETFFPGRCADIFLTYPGCSSQISDGQPGVKIGSFGILHPEVLNNFDIQYPTSSLELDLEPLL